MHGSLEGHFAKPAPFRSVCVPEETRRLIERYNDIVID